MCSRGDSTESSQCEWKLRYRFGKDNVLPDTEWGFFSSISVTGPLSEQQIAYVSRETLQVVYTKVVVIYM